MIDRVKPLVVLLATCIASNAVMADSEISEKARYLIVDTHIDTPYRHYRNALNIFDGTNAGQFDLPRALRGGLSVAFMSIYTPASAAEEGTSKQIAHEQIDWVYEIAEQSDQVGIATCTADVRNHFANELLSLPLGMENGSPMEGDPENLDAFVERGIRYVTLAHSRSNEFSDSSYDDNEAHGGLSKAGEELVKRMNRHGIMIDISHLTDKATEQVLEISESPVVATHSSIRKFVDIHRNISEELVELVGKNGGVVHINFGSTFVSQKSRDWQTAYSGAMSAYAEDKELTAEQRSAFAEEYRAEKPFPFATVAIVADHIDYVVRVAGIDHIGLGSDYDGVGDTLPIGLKDVSMFPNLIEELQARDYDDESLRKILGENLMRVWSKNEEIAKTYGNDPKCTTT